MGKKTGKREPKSKKRSLSADERRELYDQAIHSGDIDAQLQRNWLSTTARLCRHVSTSDPIHPDSFSHFWIKLHGVLVEVRNNFTNELIDAIREIPPEERAPNARMAVEVAEAITAVHKCFSRKELVYIDLNRPGFSGGSKS
ncbi:MAG: hypothetical protein AAFZ38_10750 [Myxococcota bacterium]